MTLGQISYPVFSGAVTQQVTSELSVQQKRYVDTFQAFVGSVSRLAAFISRKVSRFTLWGMLSAAVIIALAFSTSSGSIPLTLLAGIISGFPALVLLLLNNQLKAVIELPVKLEAVKTCVGIAFDKVNDTKVFDKMGRWRWKNELSLRQQLKELIGIVTVLRNVDSSLKDVGQPDLLLSIVAVANPVFFILLSTALVLNGILTFIACIFLLFQFAI